MMQRRNAMVLIAAMVRHKAASKAWDDARARISFFDRSVRDGRMPCFPVAGRVGGVKNGVQGQLDPRP